MKKTTKYSLLLPIASLIAHTADEVISGFPAWATEHFGTTTVPFFVYTHILLLALLAYGVKSSTKEGSGLWRVLLVAVQVQFIVNALFHIMSSLIFQTVTPGLYTAVFVLLPVSYYFISQTLKNKFISEVQFRVSYVLGILLYSLITASLWLEGNIEWTL